MGPCAMLKPNGISWQLWENMDEVMRERVAASTNEGPIDPALLSDALGIHNSDRDGPPGQPFECHPGIHRRLGNLLPRPISSPFKITFLQVRFCFIQKGMGSTAIIPGDGCYTFTINEDLG
jgi:hypothetical protein